jgi:ribosomal protein L11 methyltransferase
MSLTYLEFQFKVDPIQPGADILIAQLGEVGFESFVYTDKGVTGYIQKPDYDQTQLEAIQILSSSEFKITFSQSEIDQVNWNEEWEKNFDPIEVDGTCMVRAPFHAKRNVKYEIIIEPKMSFGTGHHETTFMMLQYILENDFNNKTVLDMGCGTSVLAILSEMRGAAKIDAIDIDAWCVENSKENIERNNCRNISVRLGDAQDIPVGKYDIVIANINRNILLKDMAVYKNALGANGTLYLSGFYLEDLPIIKECCNMLGFHYVDNKIKNNWIAAKFVF